MDQIQSSENLITFNNNKSVGDQNKNEFKLLSESVPEFKNENVANAENNIIEEDDDTPPTSVDNSKLYSSPSQVIVDGENEDKDKNEN